MKYVVLIDDGSFDDPLIMGPGREREEDAFEDAANILAARVSKNYRSWYRREMPDVDKRQFNRTVSDLREALSNSEHRNLQRIISLCLELMDFAEVGKEPSWRYTVAQIAPLATCETSANAFTPSAP